MNHTLLPVNLIDRGLRLFGVGRAGVGGDHFLIFFLGQIVSVQLGVVFGHSEHALGLSGGGGVVGLLHQSGVLLVIGDGGIGLIRGGGAGELGEDALEAQVGLFVLAVGFQAVGDG